MTNPRRRPAATHSRPPRALTQPAGNRAPISADTLRYAYTVHRADTHHGQIGRDCRTCTRYAQAIADAHTHRHDHPDAFEVPTSAANAYATLIRPTIGGLPPADRTP